MRSTLCLKAVMSALAALACTSGTHTAGGPMPRPLVRDAKSTFASLGSERVLEAALTYPTAKEEPAAAPVSLTASDGTGLALLSYQARAVVEGPLAMTELHLRFQNPQDRVIEGHFSITLPSGAAVSRLAMHLDTGWQEAEVVERQLARRAYEDFLHRRQDPALLEKKAGNEFSARIFPIPARGVKDIILSYSQEIVGRGAPYRLPLKGLPKVGKLDVSVLVLTPQNANAPTRERTRLAQQNYTPERDFEVALPSGVDGLRNRDLAVVRVSPKLSNDAVTFQSLLVLFDTSASRAPGFVAEVARLGALLEALKRESGNDFRLGLVAFDQRVVSLFDGKISTFAQQPLDALLARRPLGASDFDQALQFARDAGFERVLLVSDGVVTAGPGVAKEESLLALVKGMREKTKRLDVVLVGGVRDEARMQSLARGVLAQDGVVLDGEEASETLAKRLHKTTVSGIAVAAANADWVWPPRLDGLQPGDEALVYVSAPKLPGNQSLTITLTGKAKETLTIATLEVPRPLLERAAATADIARLVAERANVSDTERKAVFAKRIVDLSTGYRVVSDYTALLVLETDADYERYGIQRNALADILLVGENGVELIKRKAPIVQVATPPPPMLIPEAAKRKGRDDAERGVLGGAQEQEEEPAELKVASTPAEVQIDGRGFASGERTIDVSRANENVRLQFRGGSASDRPASGDGAAGHAEEGPVVGVPGGSLTDASRPGRAGPRAGAPSARSLHGEAAPPPPARRPPLASPGPAPSAANDPTVAATQDPSRPNTPALTGRLAEIDKLLKAQKKELALIEAIKWHNEDPGDVMALIALGETLEANGNLDLAARAYGSIIDLFPARADMRRFAGERLERLGQAGAELAVDTYAEAVRERPDHLTGHRLLAYALVRAQEIPEAFAALEAGVKQQYPGDRFAGGDRVLSEDLGLVGAAWAKQEPQRRAEIEKRAGALGATLANEPSLRFVLYWETDANDVDFHIHDAQGGHAFYSSKDLPSGGSLYADITTGYGPECFTIPGKPKAYPYRVELHYYSRGPMGYGMGKLEVLEHDGQGGLKLQQRPFVVMNDQAYVELGTIDGGL